MSAAPEISVLMPVREGRFLGSALRTIREQTVQRIEIVLIDDASDPGTQARLRDAAREDDRIRLLHRDESHGLAAALNAGLAICRAPLIARADADDVYRPDRLARQRAAFAARPALAALSCGWRRIDGAGRVLFTHRPVIGSDNVRFHTMFGGTLLHPGAMIRAEALWAVGGYDEAYWTAQDSDLWVRLAARQGLELDNLTEPLVDWRQHAASIVSVRGAEGEARALGIAVRAQRAYLGTSIPEEEVAAGIDTLSSADPAPAGRLADGLQHLKRLRARAEAVEPPGVVHYLDRAVATALARQARWALRTGHPRDAACFAGWAARWRLGQGGDSRTAVPSGRPA